MVGVWGETESRRRRYSDVDSNYGEKIFDAKIVQPILLPKNILPSSQWIKHCLISRRSLLPFEECEWAIVYIASSECWLHF